MENFFSSINSYAVIIAVDGGDQIKIFGDVMEANQPSINTAVTALD